MARVPLLSLDFEFSPKLGVRELPQLDRDHQSSVPGLYVVGDLADAPVIKVALRQGYDVARRIARRLQEAPPSEDAEVAVAVIGAGPAGIGASLALEEAGIDHVVLERETPFRTIQNFPRAKQIFAEPVSVETPGGFWFEDAPVEELIRRWRDALDAHALPIRQPVEVTGIRRRGGRFALTLRRPGEAVTGTLTAHRVILAIGRRADVRHLGVPGEDLPHVRHALRDPAECAGRAVLVVGGGDSAVEAALDCADAGAEVTLCYRRDALERPKERNRARFARAVEEGRVRFLGGTVVERIEEDRVVLRRGEERLERPCDLVLVLIGADPPREFLRRIGVRMQGEMDLRRAASIVAFAGVVYLFYGIKSKLGLWPFGEGDPLGQVPGMLEVDLGFRRVDGSFWGTCVYALTVLVFGIRAWRRHPTRQQRRRYLSLIGFQWTLLFGVPELLAPLVIERPWKIYAISVPWPLSVWSLVDAPAWAGGRAGVAVAWLLVGALGSFVAIPLYVRFHGERFCSYLCGCGALAETLGDRWRHLAPRGRTARQAEALGRGVLLLAVPVTLLLLGDAWGLLAGGALYDAAAFARHWYGLVVDFWLAAVVGVAAYPYLGNRVWCRFFCPLRAWMEVLARRFARVAIHADARCIGCGECTRVCQMGIDVQSYAQRRASLDNGTSACIQCGVCVEVCPMDVLSFGPRERVSLEVR